MVTERKTTRAHRGGLHITPIRLTKTEKPGKSECWEAAGTQELWWYCVTHLERHLTCSEAGHTRPPGRASDSWMPESLTGTHTATKMASTALLSRGRMRSHLGPVPLDRLEQANVVHTSRLGSTSYPHLTRRGARTAARPQESGEWQEPQGGSGPRGLEWVWTEAKKHNCFLCLFVCMLTYYM